MKISIFAHLGLCFFSIGLIVACATVGPTPDQKLDQAQQQQLTEIQDLSMAGESAKALEMIMVFREAHKESVYYQASRLSEAKIYFDLQDYNKAQEIYEDILSLGPEKYPTLWAQARYESTLVSEALGDDLKAITTLVGLENSLQLSDEVKFAELPARLAALYSRQGREQEVISHLDSADRGLKYLMSRTNLNREKDWLAQTLYRMGKMSMSPLSETNLAQQLQSQRRSQIYLLRAMEQEVPLWSQKAADDLILVYQQGWTFLQTHWNSLEQQPTKIERTKEMHQLISESMYRKPTNPQLWNLPLKNYYDFASKLESQVTLVLFSGHDVTPVSEESEILNSVKKKAHVQATEILPEEKIVMKKSKKSNKNDKAKAIDSNPVKKDPNL